MLSPANASPRPAGERVALGYQRPTVMSGPRTYVLLDGLKIVVSGRPSSPPMLPPTMSVRPSGSCTCPEQKRLRPYGTDVNELVEGFQSRWLLGALSQASL